MLDVTYHGLLESPPEEADAVVAATCSRSCDLDQALRRAEARGSRAGLVSASSSCSTPTTPARSCRRSAARARTPGRVRELISTELWEAINTFYLELRARNLRADLEAQPYELYGFVKRRCQMITGVAAETMPRDDGWRFLMLGWMLERAEMTCRLLDVRYGELARQ